MATVSRYLKGVGFFLDYLTMISASPVVNNGINDGVRRKLMWPI